MSNIGPRGLYRHVGDGKWELQYRFYTEGEVKKILNELIKDLTSLKVEETIWKKQTKHTRNQTVDEATKIVQQKIDKIEMRK